MKLKDFTGCLRDNADPERTVTFYDVQSPEFSVDGAAGARVSVRVGRRTGAGGAELSDAIGDFLGKLAFPGKEVTVTIEPSEGEPLFASDVLAAIEKRASGLDDAVVKIELVSPVTGASRMSAADPLWGNIAAHGNNLFALSDGGNAEGAHAAHPPLTREQAVKEVRHEQESHPVPRRHTAVGLDPLRGWKAFLDRASGLKEIRR